MRPPLGLDATFGRGAPQPGALALIAQSGAVCTVMIDWAAAHGVGFSSVVSLGGSADVDFGEAIDYFAADPQTGHILLYIEGVRDGRRLVGSLRAAARTKPVILMKVGRHPSGSRAAVSHTGAIVGRDDVFDSMAVSPDGSELAVALQISNSASSKLDMRGEIVLYSLTGGRARTWTAPGDLPAIPLDLNWISKSQLAFVWQDQLQGSATYFFTGRSQIRVLDTSASGHDLLASRVLLTAGGKLGFIQSASVGPDGSPIDVATFRVTSIGASGTATMLLAQVSPNGTVDKTFATYTRSYSGLPQEGAVTSPCQVLATDATGQHTLATCPAFGRIDNGVFTPLAHSSGDHSTAW